MQPLEIAAVLITLVTATTVIGFVWRARTGRVVEAREGADLVDVAALDPDAVAGRRATLVQFSTPVCAACQPTRVMLGEFADGTGGDIVHLDIDVTQRPDLLSRFSLLQSPTTLLLDGNGQVLARITGVPVRAELQQRLDRLDGSTPLAHSGTRPEQEQP